jgi:hypothetical protein
MGRFTEQLSPSITNLIRMDHAQVMATFHQYSLDSPARTREVLGHSLCLTLVIHAQLMEEIFLPALRGVGRDRDVLSRSQAQLDDIRLQLAKLRGMRASDPLYDQSVMQLMGTVMHHFADVETILLPDAELLLSDRLGELGAQMLKRRLQISAPRAGEFASTALRGLPTTTMMLAAGSLLAGGYMLNQRRRSHRPG